MYIVIRKTVQSLKDTDNRTLEYNSCCALHYKSSCVFMVFITRHSFAQMELMFWYVGQERLVVAMMMGREADGSEEPREQEQIPLLDTPMND